IPVPADESASPASTTHASRCRLSRCTSELTGEAESGGRSVLDDRLAAVGRQARAALAADDGLVAVRGQLGPRREHWTCPPSRSRLGVSGNTDPIPRFLTLASVGPP